MDPTKPVAALAIAGSDSGGGAGVQMDLRTMQRLGVFATTAITAVTAQNLEGVTAVQAIDRHVIAAQIGAARSGFPLAAIKTGMLWSAEIIDTVVECLVDIDVPIVVDPVMVATSGARLLDPAAGKAYRALFARCTLATPNLDEAEVLLERELDHDHLEAEAPRLADRLGCTVLLKGGHLRGDPRDVLAGPEGVRAWSHRRVADVNTHGTGCMLSSAIAARLAVGRPLDEACADGLAFVHDALERARSGTLASLANVEAAQIHRPHLTER